MLGKFNIANSVLVGMAQAVSVRAERCNRMCHKSASCSLCETNCPAGAIKVGTVGTNIRVDWDKCSYCAICVNICPTGVFGIREMSYIRFLNTYVKAISEDGTLKLSCKKVDKTEFAKDANPPVLMECLGIMGLTDLLYFYTRGARKISIYFPSCRECVNKYGQEILEDELEELNKLTEVFEYLQGTIIERDEESITITFPQQFEKPHIEEDEKEKAKNADPISRREVFSMLRKNAADSMLKSAVLLTPQAIPERTPFRGDTKELPVKRGIFLESITRLGKLLKNEVASGPYFYSQEIDDLCKYCKVCTRFCHSGALFADDEDKSIKFNASKCTSCGMCRVSCYHKYIISNQTVDLRTVFDDVLKFRVEEKTAEIE